MGLRRAPLLQGLPRLKGKDLLLHSDRPPAALLMVMACKKCASRMLGSDFMFADLLEDLDPSDPLQVLQPS
jgi:hypothetical protein